MSATVKANTNFGIDERIADLRLRLVVGEVNKRVGQRIRERRLQLLQSNGRPLTQKQVAARMRKVAEERGEEEQAVDAQRISDWERSYNMPSERYLSLLVPALELDGVSYFYAEPDAPEPVQTPDPFPDASPADLTEIKELLSAMQAEQLERATVVLEQLDDIKHSIEELQALRRRRPA